MVRNIALPTLPQKQCQGKSLLGRKGASGSSWAHFGTESQCIRNSISHMVQELNLTISRGNLAGSQFPGRDLQKLPFELSQSHTGVERNSWIADSYMPGGTENQPRESGLATSVISLTVEYFSGNLRKNRIQPALIVSLIHARLLPKTATQPLRTRGRSK